MLSSYQRPLSSLRRAMQQRIGATVEGVREDPVAAMRAVEEELSLERERKTRELMDRVLSRPANPLQFD